MEKPTKDATLEKIISLAKRRGFIFPGSEIYGGLANTYDFGPLGTELKRNLINLWWNTFVSSRSDMFGLDTSVIMSPKVWDASGHTENFTNVMIDCLTCHYRTRADHLIEDAVKNIENVEGKPLKELDEIIKDQGIKCPKCGNKTWTKVRNFNQLFETQIGIITEGKSTAYLRGELAQGMFVDFKQVLDSIHPKLPFGLAQSGKAFRNEITMGKFTFRTLEFDLAEFEYFVKPDEWEKHFEYWKKEMYEFALSLGIPAEKLRWRAHTKEELSHYSSRTEDLEYEFPWGFKEMFGLAYRTDFDLKNHIEKSGVDLRYTDPYTQNAYFEDIEKQRVVMKFPSVLAPYKVAVFPLVGNKEELSNKAKEIFTLLKAKMSTVLDERGNIGKRYFTQDEIGTPYCITVDYDTLEDDTVTVRERDTAQQKRVKINDLLNFLK
ncbi:MAG: Glycine-tRNA ligase [Candidatus Collierbacteria bacterium GW2011_GWB2_42_12]|nr:MAG: Glycine-tRNA ligase [Candidatus Collierbacteria bacterium GW2011_GWB2_42_12]